MHTSHITYHTYPITHHTYPMLAIQVIIIRVVIGHRLCYSKTLMMLRMRSFIFSFNSLILRNLARAEHSLELGPYYSYARWRVSATIRGRSGFLAEWIDDGWEGGAISAMGFILPLSREVQLSFLMLPAQSFPPNCGVRSLPQDGYSNSLRCQTSCWQVLVLVGRGIVLSGCLQGTLSFCMSEYLLEISLRMSCLLREEWSAPTIPPPIPVPSVPFLSSLYTLFGQKLQSNFLGVFSEERYSSTLALGLTSGSYRVG